MTFQEIAALLSTGEMVICRAKGTAMAPIYEAGDKLALQPYTDDRWPRRGDIVLCKLHGRYGLKLYTGRTGLGGYVVADGQGNERGMTRDFYGCVLRYPGTQRPRIRPLKVLEAAEAS